MILSEKRVITLSEKLTLDTMETIPSGLSNYLETCLIGLEEDFLEEFENDIKEVLIETINTGSSFIDYENIEVEKGIDSFSLDCDDKKIILTLFF